MHLTKKPLYFRTNICFLLRMNGVRLNYGNANAFVARSGKNNFSLENFCHKMNRLIKKLTFFET